VLLRVLSPQRSAASPQSQPSGCPPNLYLSGRAGTSCTVEYDSAEEADKDTISVNGTVKLPGAGTRCVREETVARRPALLAAELRRFRNLLDVVSSADEVLVRVSYVFFLIRQLPPPFPLSP